MFTATIKRCIEKKMNKRCDEISGSATNKNAYLNEQASKEVGLCCMTKVKPRYRKCYTLHTLKRTSIDINKPNNMLLK